MKLKFAVDQAACFKKGIDAPTSTTVVEVNPAEVSAELRTIISDYMHGIEVRQVRFSYREVDDSVVAGCLVVRPYGAFYRDASLHEAVDRAYRPNLLVVPGVTFEDLVAAVLENERALEAAWEVDAPYIWTREAWQEQLAARRRDWAPAGPSPATNLK